MGGQKLSWSSGGLVDLRHLIPGSGGDAVNFVQDDLGLADRFLADFAGCHREF